MSHFSAPEMPRGKNEKGGDCHAPTGLTTLGWSGVSLGGSDDTGVGLVVV